MCEMGFRKCELLVRHGIKYYLQRVLCWLRVQAGGRECGGGGLGWRGDGLGWRGDGPGWRGDGLGSERGWPESRTVRPGS